MSDTLRRRVASDALPGWRLILQRMHLTVTTGSYAESLAFAARVGEVGVQHDHPVGIDVRGPRVHLTLQTSAVFGVTDADVVVGQAISALVSSAGLAVEHPSLTEVEVAIDVLDLEAVRPFWAAVLGWPAAEWDIEDPYRIGPSFWFQQMDEPRPQRNRIHLDVAVPHDEAVPRIEAALAAGGRVVSSDRAPAWWVLADPEGNEACICTWEARDEDPPTGPVPYKD